MADTVLEVADREFPEREKLERYVLSSLLSSPVEAFEKAICLAVSEEILRKVYSDDGIGGDEFIKFHAMTTMKKLNNLIDELKEVADTKED